MRSRIDASLELMRGQCSALRSSLARDDVPATTCCFDSIADSARACYLCADVIQDVTIKR